MPMEPLSLFQNKRLGEYCWIYVERIRQPGREGYELKPKAVTESYFNLLEDGKLQHTILVADWDTITPEALWVGSKPLAEKIIETLNRRTSIRCQIRAIPKSMINLKAGILNFQEPKLMEQLIQSASKELNVAEVPDPPVTDNNQIEDDVRRSLTKKLLFPLANLVFDTELARKLILGKHPPIDYITIYYYRTEDDPPLYTNVLSYPACLVRFTPKFPEGWRYMCGMDTYAKLLKSKFFHLIEKEWYATFSEEQLDEVLNDENLFRDITMELAISIIWEGELFGNKV